MLLGVILATLSAQTTPSTTPSRKTCPTTPVKLVHEAAFDSYHITGEASPVRLDVLVNAAGIVESVSIAKRSRFSAFDFEAVEVAINSKYVPRTINCKPVPSVYHFSTNWSSGFTE